MSTSVSRLLTGDGRITSIAKIVQLIKDTTSLSLPTGGKISKFGPNTFSLTGYFETFDCDSLDKIRTSKVYHLSRNPKEKNCIDSVQCISEPRLVAELLSASSENGRFLARLKAGSGEKSSGQYLEIWDRSKLLKTINLSEFTEHGQVNTDAHFSSFTWSPFGDQDKLVYVCQPKKPKCESFFKLLDSKKPESTEEKAKEVLYGEEFTKKEDWGECLNGIEHTLVAVLDVSDNCKVRVLDMKGYSLGNVQWLKDNKTVSVAYQEEPRRVGIIYCNNRPSKIVIHDWSQSTPTEVFSCAEENLCFHTPRVNNSGSQLLFLGNPVFGAHIHASKIYLLSSEMGGARRELVDESTGQSEFFVGTLPKNCFSMDDKFILFDDISDYFHNQMCLFDLDKSKLTRIKFPTVGLTLLDFRYDLVLAKGDDLNMTPTLFVGSLNSDDYGQLVAWHQIEDCIHLDELDYETIKIPIPGQNLETFLSAILISPRLDSLYRNFPNLAIGTESKSASINNTSQLPTIVIVHGGPNTAFSISYYRDAVLYTRLGCKLLLVNYRGSTGVNEAYSNQLCGNIGKMDVDDCMLAIRHLAANKAIDPTKLVLWGGSHGGFLACHLSCQTEFKFTSAIIKNPVVDLSTLYATSDIPDWSLDQALGAGAFSFKSVPTNDQLKKMFECSPMSKVDSANVPTLMMLGNKDRRVNMFQGERWVDALKAKGIEVSCKIYPDEHSLATKNEVAADVMISTAIFILNHLK